MTPLPTTEIGIVTLLFGNIILQIAQMFFDTKRDSDKTNLNQLRQEVDQMRSQISNLQKEVFELTKEKAYLTGKIEAQQAQKITLIKEKLKK